MRHALLLALVVALSPTHARGTEPETTGSVCINRFGPDPPAPCPTGPASPEWNPVPEFRWESTVFRIRIDDREPVEISCDRSATVDALPLGSKHVVRIWVGERRLESFRFSFEERGSTRLCLSFGPGYGTWMLDAVQPGTNRPCRCLPSRSPDAVGGVTE